MKVIDRAERTMEAMREAARARRTSSGRPLSSYRDDPVGYCKDKLEVVLTPTQQQIARLLLVPPCRVLVPSGHNVGKSFLAACMVCWWYDTRDPGVCLTTAPTDRQVRDILWKEVRKLRARARLSGLAGPKICRLESAPDHFAHGFTARDGASFQGQHEAEVFVVFDEAEGVAPVFWESSETMLGNNGPMLCIYNPTTQDSQASVEERSGAWHLLRMSTIDHPNVIAEAAGEAPPFPAAIRLGRLEEMLRKWCQPVAPGDERPGDVTLQGKTYRPGPVAQARLLGLRPDLAFDQVWSIAVFELALNRALPLCGPLQIGCDVARFGDDDTAFHVRRGGVSLHHERFNGISTDRTEERCKQLACDFASKHGFDARKVAIAVDDCGVGGGVTDHLAADGWNVVGVNAAIGTPESQDWPNLRSALWFGLADEAAAGNVSFSLLAREVTEDLRRELTAPKYSMDIRGRRCVEPKLKTKERIGRSPDNADACLLAYANVNAVPDRVTGRIEVPR